MIGLMLTAPASRKFMFMNTPKKAGIPSLNGGIRTCCLRYTTMRKARDCSAQMRGEDPGITYMLTEVISKSGGVASQFFKSSSKPLITNIQTNDQPDPGHTRIGKQKACDRWLRDLNDGLWPNALYSTTHDLFISSLERNTQFSHRV